MKKLILLFIIMLLIGSVFLLIGIFDISNRLDLMKNGLKTQGIVTQLEKHVTKRSYSYRPVIEFTTDSGKHIKRAYSWTSNSKTYWVGQRVDIIYSAKDPKNFMIGSYFEFGPIAFILAGVAIAALDIFILIKKLKFIMSLAPDQK